MKPIMYQSQMTAMIIFSVIGSAMVVSGCDDSSSAKMTAAGEEISDDMAGEHTLAGTDMGAAGETGGMTRGGERTSDMMIAGTVSEDMMTSGEIAEDMMRPNVTQVCEESIILNCDSGVQRVNTAAGQSSVSTYTCGDGFNYPGQELIFEFIEDESQEILINVTPVEAQNLVNYIVFALEGDRTSCDPSIAPCLGRQDSIINEPLRVDYQSDVPLWFTIDPRLIDDRTMEFDVEVLCNVMTCGDGLVNDDETCDDGNAISGDGCNAECALEEGYTCQGMPSICTPDPVERTCTNMIEAAPGIYQGNTQECDSTYDTVSGGCGNANGVTGGDQSYLVTIPARQVLKAQVVSTDDVSPATLWLALDPEDPAETCVQSSASLYWQNGSDEARTVLVVVDGTSATSEGPYQLTLELFNTPDRVGTSCANPIDLIGSGVYQGDTSGGAQAASNLHGGVGGACVRSGGFWGYNRGPDQVYRVTLQPDQSLSVNATVTSTWDHVISIHNDCALFELACLVWDDFGIGRVTNETEIAQEYYIMVSGFHGYSSGSFDLNVTVE